MSAGAQDIGHSDIGITNTKPTAGFRRQKRLVPNRHIWLTSIF